MKAESEEFTLDEIKKRGLFEMKSEELLEAFCLSKEFFAHLGELESGI
jgi:hypothetical protein